MARVYSIVILFFLILAGFLPLRVLAATLHLSPASGSYHVGENFEVSILVDSDTNINAVSGVLTFPTKYLKILEISKKKSIFNFWVEEPSFSNAGDFGNLRLEGVILNPGFTGKDGVIASITLRADKEGTASLTFTQLSILANDGLGTNIATLNSPVNFTLLAPKTLSTQAKEPASEPQLIIIKELQPEKLSAILSFWEFIPGWVKVSVLISIGLATIVFSFIILSFGIIVLIWIWSNAWHRRYQLIAIIYLLTKTLKSAIFKMLGVFGAAKTEVKGDINYSLSQLIKQFKQASQPASFKSLIRSSFLLFYDILKRFFTKNTVDNPKNNDFDLGDRSG